MEGKAVFLVAVAYIAQFYNLNPFCFDQFRKKLL